MSRRMWSIVVEHHPDLTIDELARRAASFSAEA
jgi:hypothetical protein